MSEKPLALPLIAVVSNRGEQADVDARLINGFVEKTELDGVWCYKRPGYETYYNGFTGVGRGTYFWDEGTASLLGDVYSVFGSNLYRGSTVLGAVNADTDMYTFAGSQGATPKLFMNCSTKAYTTDGTTVTQVTDVDYPALTVPGAVNLDGTIYVMTPDAYILGSDLNDPTSWDSLNSIRVQIDPGKGVAIAKQLNYLIAFKEFSTEVFYDAANAAGSPLGRVEAAKLGVGCAAADSIASIDGALIWVSGSAKAGRKVMLMEALKAKEVSTPAVERLLQSLDSPKGTAFGISGHRFYVLTDIFFGMQRTLVYDLDEKLWFEWEAVDGGTLQFISSTVGSNQEVLVQLYDAEVVRIRSSLNADKGQAFSWDLYTPNFDAGTRLGKVVNKLEVTADQQNNSMLEVRFSDDDYQTWSPARTLDLSRKQAWTTKMGKFVKRAHWFHQRLNVPLRIKAVDLHTDLCTL